MTNATYRVMEVTAPGTLTLAERDTPAPQDGEVLIAVEACGMCGADVGDIERSGPTRQPPRVPGHEVIGRIVALGSGISSRWELGQRVGVGRLGRLSLEHDRDHLEPADDGGCRDRHGVETLLGGP